MYATSSRQKKYMCSQAQSRVFETIAQHISILNEDSIQQDESCANQESHELLRVL